MSLGFQTTRWTLVLRAAGQPSLERTAALSELLAQNWYPLYAFLRRSGKRVDETEDLIQGFFVQILEKNLFARIQQHRQGRFRNYLLVCLKNYVTNQWQHDRAEKRGGAQKSLSLDLSTAEQRYQIEPSHEATPERAFDRAWANELLERSLQEIADRWRTDGRSEKFELLKNFLMPSEKEPRDEVAKNLGMSKATLDVAIHRLRAEFRRELCQQVAQTLDRGDLLEDEINLLFSAFSM